uniref:Uncharacterized protein n=1 Tax=viral metagenome TaxID=1070528 RepID=A0A6M3JDT9_9ZZZZ
MISLRETQFYKDMTNYDAVGLAEGFVEAESEEEELAAWQYIYDHRMYRYLQGWFGRTVESLLNQGVIAK